MFVLLPSITHFVREGTMSSALCPSPKGLSHSRCMCIRSGTEANGSHFRYFKQRNGLERLEPQKREEGMLEVRKGRRGDT